MASRKCVYKKNSLDYDEEEFFTSRCFEISSDVQLKEIPSNGEEYLLKVIEERSKYAPVLQCDYKKLRKKLTRNEEPYLKEAASPASPNPLKPTIEWQNIQIADFSDVRMYIQQMLVKKLLPTAIKDIELSKHRVKEWEPLFDNEEPTMSHVVGVSQSILDDGLDILIERLGSIKPDHTIDRRTGQWIYTILAVTRYPHLQDTSTKLRALARKCLKIRSQIHPETDNAQELAAPMNLFICLVARYFGQKDLAD